MIKVDRAIKTAIQLFPMAYDSKVGYQPFHFAFIYLRNKLISTGVNSYTECPKIKKMGEIYNLPNQRKYKFPHAETNAISKILFSNSNIELSKMSIVCIRLNKKLELQNSKPCSECLTIINSVGINKIYYSSKKGVKELIIRSNLST